MRSLFYTVLTTLYLAQPIMAAESAPPENDPDTTPIVASASQDASDENEKSTDAGETDTQDNGLTPPEDQDFVPSIRITEDLPVAFPVDI